jgi:hypothetical protein
MVEEAVRVVTLQEFIHLHVLMEFLRILVRIIWLKILKALIARRCSYAKTARVHLRLRGRPINRIAGQ